MSTFLSSARGSPTKPPQPPSSTNTTQSNPSALNFAAAATSSFSMGFKSSGFQGLSLPLHTVAQQPLLGGSSSTTTSTIMDHHDHGGSHVYHQNSSRSSTSSTTSSSPPSHGSSFTQPSMNFGFIESTSKSSTTNNNTQQQAILLKSNNSNNNQRPPSNLFFSQASPNSSSNSPTNSSTANKTSYPENDLEFLRQQIEETKEKYETFRKGFLIERNQRLKTVHDLYKFTKKMEVLQKQLFEKDSALLVLTTENVKLKEEIYEIQKFGGSNGASTSNSVTPSSQANNQSNSNTSSNNNNTNGESKKRQGFLFTKRRNLSSDAADTTNNASSNSENKNEFGVTDSPSKINNESKLDAIQEMKHWRELYRKTQNDLKKREKQISDLQSQEHVQKQMLQEIQSKYRSVEVTLSKHQETINTLKSELFEKEQLSMKALNDNDFLQQQLTMERTEHQRWKDEFLENYKNLEETATSLKNEIERKDLDLRRLTEKCMELKEQLNSVRLQIRKFKCKRISHGGLASKFGLGSSTKHDAAIILHKNPKNGLLWVDIKLRSGKDDNLDLNNAIHSNMVQSHPLTSITDIVPDVHDSKRFSIYFFSNATASPSKNTPNAVVETFECSSESERTEIMQGIQEFISIAAQSN
ncbi:hypothetical protein C9374_001071 [Naegleria lovaniensis]|uniref:Uncharacterized protein n=1 Tax=Naegleria lovaniensis TaxID=51637 RepID=A0AA88GYA5_NAELO|nr:uncharacterized protein C9374_001071 [Naegleria lovaniensis]KAG2388221.1 hypothetical protein C9374_001071 [Naegleria lovaniensis]